METATLILTKEEIEQFRQFQKNVDVFNILLEAGAFDVQFGKCILNFYQGTLQNVVREEIVYKRT